MQYDAVNSHLPIGSVDDDWRELKRLIDNPDHEPSAVDIERLGNVLRAMSETLSPKANACADGDS